MPDSVLAVRRQPTANGRTTAVGVITLPDELARRIAAAARGENAEDLALTVSGSSPMLAPARRPHPSRRAGVSPHRDQVDWERGFSTPVDELLADGFGHVRAVLSVDTGPLVAFPDQDDRLHQACLLRAGNGHGAAHAGRAGHRRSRIPVESGADARRDVQDGTLTIEPLGSPDLNRVAELLDRYEDLPLGVTDASLIAIAERLSAVEVESLDRRHFRVVRPSRCDAFILKTEHIEASRRSG